MEINATKQIKTIRDRLNRSEKFDVEVNQALAGGWCLIKRYTIPAYAGNEYTMLVAELQRYVHD